MGQSTDTLLNDLLESTSDPIMIADSEGKPLAFNSAYVAVIREALAIEMRPGLQPHKLLDDPQQIALWEGVHRRALGGERFTFEYALRLSESDERYYQFAFTPVFRDGKVTGFTEVARDITALKRTEQALAATARDLNESQEVARVGSYHLDITSDCWRSSPMLDRIFGISADDKRTIESWGEIIHPDHRQEMLDYFRSEVLGQGKPFDREYQIIRRDDQQVRWVHGLGRLHLDESGAPIGMLGTIRDITEQRLLEERLRQRDRLEAIGQLAGGVAHDFNNQLMVILGFVDLLEGQIANPNEVNPHILGIRRAAESAARLTDELLAFARKGRKQNSAVDLHQLVEQVRSILLHTVDKRIVIETRLEAKRAMTYGDPALLQNALLNLAINARDAMAEGGKLTFCSRAVTLESDDPQLKLPAGEYIELGVSDTGDGIPQHVQQQIFEPFFTTKGTAGTGMGLAAVYGTIKSHRGAIRVDSAINSGTTFTLILPWHAGAARDTTKPRGRGQTSPQLRGRTALVVDDEPLVRNVIVEMLRRRGCDTQACEDGVAAVELIRSKKETIDFVVIDVTMPRLDGVTALSRMRDHHPTLRAILTSGYDKLASASDNQDERTYFLRKPFRIDEFYDALDQLWNPQERAGGA
ncbi:MAG: response regulator [Deltaproteobacteria bacterium]|nr:response regulator [Deltaproteobacteria bacterium]